jgi:hypothetical protein
MTESGDARSIKALRMVTTMKLSKKLAGVVAGAALISAGYVVTAPPASAAPCPGAHDVFISGGESHYSLTCLSNGRVRVSGNYTDTRADGRCVQVRIDFGNRSVTTARACPSGQTREFSETGTRINGTSNAAEVRTFTVPASSAALAS